MKRITNSIDLHLFIAAVCFLFLCPACLSRIAFGNGDNWIPKEFDPKHSVFLIQYFGDEDRAKEFMKKNYPYPYEFVSTRDPAEFPDKSKYRFVLVPTGQIVGNAAGGPDSHSASAMDFYFYDRMTGKRHPNLEKGSYKGMVTFKPVIKTIVRHTGG